MSGYNAKFYVVDPDKMEFELTLKMSLGDWKKLKEQLNSSSFPSWQIGQSISEMVLKANREFYADSEGLPVT